MNKRIKDLQKKAIKLIVPRLAITTIVSISNAIISFVAQIWLLKYILNAVTKKEYLDIVFALLLVFLLQLLMNVVNSYVNTVLYPRLDNKIRAGFQSFIFEFTASVDIESFDEQDYFDKMHRVIFQSNGRIIEVINLYGRLLNAITMFIMISLFLFESSLILLLMALIPMFSNILVGRLQNKFNYEKSIEMTGEIRRNEYFKRIIYQKKYAKEIRVTNIISLVKEMFSLSVENNISIIKTYSLVNICMDLLMKGINTLSINCGIVLCVAYKAMVLHTFSVTACIVLIRSLWQLNNSFVQISDVILDLHEQYLYLIDVKTFFNVETHINNPEKQKSDVCRFKNEMVFQNVYFKYKNSNEYTLSDINITIKKGQKIALVGANGSGKTTLLKLLLRLYDATEGTIRLDGVDIKDLNYTSYRNLFGVELQDFRIFAMPLKNNIYVEKEPGKIENLYVISGIRSIIERCANGLNTNMTKEFDDNGEYLSGGEEQRIALARAYSKDADIMVLDEPSSALDPIAEHEIFTNMMRICKNKTLIMISHRLSSVIDADCIYMIEDGRIIETGTHDELMQYNGKYAKLFNVQAKKYLEGVNL